MLVAKGDFHVRKSSPDLCHGPEQQWRVGWIGYSQSIMWAKFDALGQQVTINAISGVAYGQKMAKVIENGAVR